MQCCMLLFLITSVKTDFQMNLFKVQAGHNGVELAICVKTYSWLVIRVYNALTRADGVCSVYFDAGQMATSSHSSGKFV